MQQIVIDFETRSCVPIESGLHNYFNAHDAKVLCLAYKIGNLPTQLWTPNHKQPFDPTKYTIYAHNIQFDWMAWNILLPQFTPIPIENCVDIMAICGRFTSPQGLDQAARLINKKDYKDRKGKQLIKDCCIPPYDNSPEKLRSLYKYCIQDVDAEYELLNRLPSTTLSKQEQKIWLSTVKINQQGLPVDIETAKLLKKKTGVYKEEKLKYIPEITNGEVNKITQNIAIKNWINNKTSLNLSDLTKNTVKNTLKRDDLPEDVREILTLRKEFGKTSLAKFESIITQEHKGRIYNNLRYYGASTGRFAGMGFQAHNLPRGSISYNEFEKLIFMFKTGEIFFSDESIMDKAKQMIRGLLCTDGNHALVWADYANIETRMLFWLAGENVALHKLGKGEDLYVDMAAYLTYKQHKDITKDERFIGKTLILLCGYQGGAKKFFTSVNDSGKMNITHDYAEKAIKMYRKKYSRVVTMWYSYAAAVMNAVKHRGIEYKTHKCAFKVVKDKLNRPWLKISIPSGRNLYYFNPTVGKGKFGEEVKHEGINSYTHKWGNLSLSPGRITENIDQALSRDILCLHTLAIQKKYNVGLTVHDEIICEVDNAEVEDCNNFMLKTMTTSPFWCKHLPLNVEIKTSRRYSK